MEPGRLLRGAIAGFAGGVAFGVLLQGMGLMTVISRLVQADSIALGWMSHLVISWVFGIAFALAVKVRGVGDGLAWGLAYGAVLWVVAGLTGLHGILGVPLGFTGTAALILVGHLLYGAALGLAYAFLEVGMSRGLARRARPA